jgi:hypothetical protein
MDPYSAIVNDKSQPSYDDDALNLSDLPAFDVQYTLPSINYYNSKSRINQNAPSTLILNQTQTASDKSPQSSTNNVQVPDIYFSDDSFDFEIASLQNPEIENLLNNIGNETLNQLANQNQRFSNRFVHNSENERISFIHSRENINTTRKMNSAMRTFEQYLNSAKTEFRRVCTIPSRRAGYLFARILCRN